MKIIETDSGNIIKCWADSLEDNCLEQAKAVADLPYLSEPLALMPDAHLGCGFPIGSVVVTRNRIFPMAVGADCGCGMKLFELNILLTDEQVKAVADKIKEVIPTGFNRNYDINVIGNRDCYYKNKCVSVKEAIGSIFNLNGESFCGMKEEEIKELALAQVGTLGGGNHFIEIQTDMEYKMPTTWVMIHTGSRNLGKRLADHYSIVAKEFCDYLLDVNCRLPRYTEFLPRYVSEDGSKVSGDGARYIIDYNRCIDFAKLNRDTIKSIIMDIISDVVGDKEVNAIFNIDDCHNFIELDFPYEGVVTHRKGAIKASSDMHIIPGSMGTSSFVVQGKTNSESYMSASHGAGRVCSRTKADKEARKNLDTTLKSMEHVYYEKSDNYDEFPAAYKDIKSVLAQEGDLVVPLIELKPVAVIKDTTKKRNRKTKKGEK